MILKDIVYLAWAVFYRFIAFFARKLTKWKDDEVYFCFFSPYFGGNEKPVALYMKEHRKDIERRTGKKISLYFMSENRNQPRFARKYGIDAYWHHDPAAIPLLAKTKIFVTTHGEGLPISRRKYFLDFIQVSSAEEIEMYISGGMQPCIFKESGKDDYINGVMPMKS